LSYDNRNDNNKEENKDDFDDLRGSINADTTVMTNDHNMLSFSVNYEDKHHTSEDKFNKKETNQMFMGLY
jgi:hypothetical protein